MELIASSDDHEVSTNCESRELNPDGLPHWILSPARLPIPPLSRRFFPTIRRRRCHFFGNRWIVGHASLLCHRGEQAPRVLLLHFC